MKFYVSAMCSRIYMSLLFDLFLVQFCRSKSFKLCKDAVDSIEFVTSCPTSKDEWKSAANKKNCSATASLWKSCTANEYRPFVYHCLVDDQRTKLLEICAPDILIFGGFCAGFNVVEGNIQVQYSYSCDEKFPECDLVYPSSDVYKYPYCFELASTPKNTTENTKTKDAADDTVLEYVMLAIMELFVVIFVLTCAKQICRRIRRHQLQNIQTEEHEQFELRNVCSVVNVEKSKERYRRRYRRRLKNKSSNMAEIKVSTVVCKKENYRSRRPRVISSQREEVEMHLFDAVEFEKENYRRRRPQLISSQREEVEIHLLDAVEFETENYRRRRPQVVPNQREEVEIHLFDAVEFEKDKRFSRRTETERTTTTDRYSFIRINSREESSEENKDFSNKYLEGYKTMDQYFLETAFCKKANSIFENESIVILTGPTGCGKTISAIHLILKHLHDKGKTWTFRKIHSLEELLFLDSDEHSLVFIDNIFYRTSMDEEFKIWWHELDKIYDKFLAGKSLRFVFTARTNVIERACSYMSKPIPFFRKEVLIDASLLTNQEKEEILSKQIAFAEKERKLTSIPTMDSKFKSDIIESIGPIGFPLCAHLYVCGKAYQKSGAMFFARPIEYLKLQIRDEIETDKSNRVKSLLFVLFFYEWRRMMGKFEKLNLNEIHCSRFLDNISPDLQRHFGPFYFKDLAEEAKLLIGTFLQEESKNTYKFIHDSVYEAVVAYFCETYVIEAIKYFPLNFIQTQHYESLTQMQTSALATRLMYEALNKQLSEVFSCKILRQKTFADYFCWMLERKHDNTVKLFFTVENESSPEKFTCMFWANLNNLTYLTELLCDIAIRKNFNPTYQLYVSLYGKCCVRNGDLSRITDGAPYNNFEKIKECVFRYKDIEGNNILHLIIASDFSDTFVAFAVENLVRDGTGDINGDTALSLAAKEANQSRILSIIELLESVDGIINSLDKDGYSPLQLSVISLKGESSYVELECCVRVIIFLLYGANPEKLSNQNETAFGRCEYRNVKTILRYPDEQNMEIALECILEKLEKKVFRVTKQKLMFSSKMIRHSLRMRIEQAMHHLKNITFVNEE